jgi:hypothetical protein
MSRVIPLFGSIVVVHTSPPTKVRSSSHRTITTVTHTTILPLPDMSLLKHVIVPFRATAFRDDDVNSNADGSCTSNDSSAHSKRSGKPKQQIVFNQPRSLPLYARVCKEEVKYASACSCIGAPASTITASSSSDVAKGDGHGETKVVWVTSTVKGTVTRTLALEERSGVLEVGDADMVIITVHRTGRDGVFKGVGL